MTLVWHIFRKDWRHTWIYAAAAQILLLLAGLNWTRVLQASHREQHALLNLQFPTEILLAVAWVLLCGVLLHREALPGTRQYWLVRPIRWQDLLLAKAVFLVLAVAAPLAAVQLAQVAMSGFPLFENIAPILWNAILAALICVLPTAVLASITRNLQQLILWALGVGGAVSLLRLLVIGFPDDLRWVTNSVTVVVGAAGGIAILLWQYRTRNTLQGRIAVAGLVLVLGTIEYWPASVWYAIQRAASPQTLPADSARLQVESDHIDWLPQKFYGPRPRINSFVQIPIRIDDLPDGVSLALNGFSRLSVQSGGESHPNLDASSARLLGEGSDRHLELEVNQDFAMRHRNEPMQIEAALEFTVYDAPRYHSMPVNGETFIPGLGRCRTQTGDSLLIVCQSVFGAKSKVLGYWAKGIPTKGAIQVMSQLEERSPLLLLPTLHPVSFITGGFGASSSYAEKDIVFVLRKPLAHVQRKIELRNIVLANYRR